MDNEEAEISDLQTAKIALHGALAMVRNLQDLNQRLKGEVQDASSREKLVQKRELEAQSTLTRSQGELNQLKLYYTAFEETLKDKARHEATREQELKWEREMRRFQEAVDTLEKSRALKDDELKRAREDIAKKDKAITEIHEQNTAAKMRTQAEWSNALDRFEIKHQERLNAAMKDVEKDVQSQWAQRLAQLEERCQSLEQELADKDHLLTQRFHERLQKILAQGKLREQSLWDQTQRLRETFEAELRDRFQQRLEAKEMEHKAALVALETRLLEQMRIAENDWTVREKALRDEHDQALHEAHLIARTPEAQLHEERNAYRARLEEDYKAKEKLLRETYFELQRKVDEQAKQQDIDSLQRLADEKEKLLKSHNDILHTQLSKADERHQQELAGQMRELTQLRSQLLQAQNQSQALQQQLTMAEDERRQLSERMAAIELMTARSAHDAEVAQRAAEHALEDKHRAQRGALQEEIHKRDVEKRDLEQELRLVKEHAEGLRVALSANETKIAARYAALEKSLHDKERELEAQERRFKETATEKQLVIARGSADFEKRDGELKEAAALLDQRQMQLGILEKQCESLRDQLMTALKQGPAVPTGTTPNFAALLDEWMFGFAHQVRNPLAVIRTTAEALSDVKAAPAQAKALEGIVQSVDSLSARLAQFMEFSKPLEPLFKPVALQQVVRDALVGIRDGFARANIQVNVTSDEKLPLVPGHAIQFQDALTELLLNALEALPQGGALDIRLRYDAAQDQVVVTFADSGRGINSDHLRQIGKPFFTTKAGHAGLGLAHVKRILRMYAGDFQVESPLSGGTQVHCYFRRKGWTA